MIMTKYPKNDRIPAVLVHGWHSHPGIWNRLTPLLEKASVPVWKFDHTGMAAESIPAIAAAFGEYIGTMRDREGYSGRIDIVCHSIGTCVARYYLEVLDRTSRKERVRQLIGLGPPNNGSAMADLFCDPVRGEEIINRLTGVFVPQGYDPSNDLIVQDVRPKSKVMHDLRTAGIRPDITYRIIVTGNPGEIPDFFPRFGGRTWEQTTDGKYRTTFDGDGLVPHGESALPGITLDRIRAEEQGEGFPLPGQYCHINLPRNPVVMDRVLGYLTRPARESSSTSHHS